MSFGGRWTPKGFPAVYTAQTESLAALEQFVQRGDEGSPLKDNVIQLLRGSNSTRQDNSIDEFVRIEKTPFREAVKIAFSEEKDGPGITGF